MVTRGRGIGRGRGRGHNVPPQPSPSSHISPPLQLSQHSPALADPPTSSLNVVPSSGEYHIETDSKELIYVAPVPEPRRFLPSRVTRDIMYNVMTRMPIPTSTWREYPTDMKDILFKDFMNKHRFASDHDRGMARTVWERTCMDLYPDHLNRARDKAFDRANSNNLADIKGHGPRGMRTKVWDGLVDVWLTEKWMRRSKATRRNRAVMPDALKHTEGSISFGQHKNKMEAELKHSVSYRDFYTKVHKKKDGSFVSERSRNFVESYATAMSEKYGENSLTNPMVDSEVWLDAAGPNKKGRVHDIGNNLHIGINNTMHGSSSEVAGPSCSTPLTQDISEAVNAAVAAAMTSFVQTQLVPMLALILSMVQSANLAPQAPSQCQAAREGREDDDNKDEEKLD